MFSKCGKDYDAVFIYKREEYAKSKYITTLIYKYRIYFTISL